MFKIRYIDQFEGFYIYHYREVSSTNTVALDLIDHGISNEAIVIADKQTNGRGRIGKRWISPIGNFYASLIISQATAEFVFIAALAIGNTLLSFIDNLSIQYKWPNDIMVDKKKISGILLEKKSNSQWLVIGVGINILSAPLLETASISEYGKSISSIDLLKEIVINFNILRNLWQSYGFYVIQEMWLKRALNLNERISIKLIDKIYYGIFVGIDEYGRLILQQKEKSLVYFNTGELFDML